MLAQSVPERWAECAKGETTTEAVAIAAAAATAAAAAAEVLETEPLCAALCNRLGHCAVAGFTQLAFLQNKYRNAVFSVNS